MAVHLSLFYGGSIVQGGGSHLPYVRAGDPLPQRFLPEGGHSLADGARFEGFPFLRSEEGLFTLVGELGPYMLDERLELLVQGTVHTQRSRGHPWLSYGELRTLRSQCHCLRPY